MRKMFPNPSGWILILFLALFFIGPTSAYPFSGFHGSNSEILLAKAKKKSKKKKETKKKPSEEANHLSPKRTTKVISRKFPVPPSLKIPVDFWTMVYTKYDRNFEIFHDTEKLNIIYSVIDFTDLYSNPLLTRKDRLAVLRPRLEAEENRIQEMLLRIHEKQYQPETLSKEEKRIYDLFKDDPNPDKFLEASHVKRIRAQTGIKNKFIEAVKTAGGYIGEFEDIFMQYGLPIELTRLVFVESMFNLKARSKVGASGPWQFMPGTGRLYGLQVNALVDDRNDPFLATHAAARLLKDNYERLGTWPLALNAYNSGRGTMMRAVEAMGTSDITTIIHNYRGGVYGFASRNFYPSFLAALHVANNYPKYFGKLKRDPKVEYDTYLVQNAVYLGDLALAAGYSQEELGDLNPQYTNPIHQNLKKIPPGYAIRIPKGTLDRFSAAEIALANQGE